MEWLLTLLFGTGAAFTPSPTSLPNGEIFLLAPKPLKPVSDGMRVSIGIGTTTNDAKSSVLSGSLKIADYGNLSVAVCKTANECLAMSSAGTFFSKESYGFAFSGSGSAFRGNHFIGIKIVSSKALSNVRVSWSNFIQ